jgi:hypothetical protein
MRNSVLHLLTNRNSNFASGIFPQSGTYEAHEEGREEAALRDFLKLRPQDHAFYLVGMLNAVYSFSEIYEEFRESDRSFSLSDYVREADTFDGGVLVNSAGKSAAIQRYPLEFPIEFEISVKYLSETEVKIFLGKSEMTAPYSIRTAGIDIDWPITLGVGGLLLPDGVDWKVNWKTGASFKMRHEPLSFPYGALDRKIGNNPDYLKLLVDAALIRQYYSAQTAMERVAILCLALARPDLYATN